MTFWLGFVCGLAVVPLVRLLLDARERRREAAIDIHKERREMFVRDGRR